MSIFAKSAAGLLLGTFLTACGDIQAPEGHGCHVAFGAKNEGPVELSQAWEVIITNAKGEATQAGSFKRFTVDLEANTCTDLNPRTGDVTIYPIVTAMKIK